MEYNDVWGLQQALNERLKEDDPRLVAALEEKAPTDHGHLAATPDTAGFMSAADKQKLEGLNQAFISSVQGLSAALDTKAPRVHSHEIDDVTGLRAELERIVTSPQQSTIDQVTGLQTALDAKAPKVHSHAIDQVTGLQTALDAKAPSTHNHDIANVIGLQTALDAKAPSTHNHAISQIFNLQTVLDSKAPRINATTSSPGLMSAADKSKLDGLSGTSTGTFNSSPQLLTYTASQSSVYGSTTPGTFANLTDGSMTTGAATIQGANQWIKADLGAVKYFNRIALSGGALPNWGSVAFYLNNHSIEISNDDSEWLILVPSISLVSDTEQTQFTFGAVAARYVRLRTRTNNYLATCEFRILG